MLTHVHSSGAEENSPEKKLYLAILTQELPIVQSLLGSGAKADYRENGRPLLGWAAQTGNVPIVEALLKAGANPNVADENIGHTPLMRAIETRFPEVVKVLLSSKANPNAKSADGKSCLVMAVESQTPAIVQAVVDGGADIKQVTADGDSPALTAAQDGTETSFEIIRILGKAGANFNASNAAYTPLIYALEQSNPALVTVLLEAGSDANTPNKSGRLPIQAALDNPELLTLLLKAKADPNSKLGYGDTPLIQAIQNGKPEVVKLLLDAGADPKVADSSGSSPLELAERSSQPEIVALLKQRTETLPIVAVESNGTTCTIVDAARKQMEIHGLLQAQVDAGKRSSEIFRTFSDDTKEYGRLLTENPAEACRLLERLRIKYGV